MQLLVSVCFSVIVCASNNVQKVCEPASSCLIAVRLLYPL